MTRASQLDGLEWLGGHLALDFVNTVSTRAAPAARDYLLSFDDLLEWGRRAGIVGPATAAALGRATSPRRGCQLLSEAMALREALHRSFRAVMTQRQPPAGPLATLNAALEATTRYRRLEGDRYGLDWRWQITADEPRALLGPIAWSAAALLASAERERVKECPPPDGCGWLFLDDSRNGSRTWCSMRTCGNVAKVRRFRRRQAPKKDRRRAPGAV